jgi:2-keto-4-pentenoate hydratase/2-oxohepta-3-ene-1,7-dioic acid hydratase in catechol pathway
VRLLTRASDDGERLAVTLDGWRAIDVDDLLGGGRWTMERLLDDASDATARISAMLDGLLAGPFRPLADIELLAPVVRPGKIIAVGRNYADHAAEQGVATADDPILFTKYGSSIVADGADIVWRAADTQQVDYEAELAVVIGTTARDVPQERALDHVLGYACLNDVSARDLQFGDGQWVRGKSLDTFCPFGPWIVTADEIPDPQALRIRCLVNGEVLQDANTSQMLHGVAALIAFCSRFFTLEPGDVIATGTPAGVGVFRKPPRFLGDGDEVVIDIEGVGQLRNRCVVAPDRGS